MLAQITYPLIYLYFYSSILDFALIFFPRRSPFCPKFWFSDHQSRGPTVSVYWISVCMSVFTPRLCWLWVNDEITSILVQFSTHLTTIAWGLGGDLGGILEGILEEILEGTLEGILERILEGILEWNLEWILQLPWSDYLVLVPRELGLCIKPGRSTGTASHMAQATVARSEGLLCPASLGT